MVYGVLGRLLGTLRVPAGSLSVSLVAGRRGGASPPKALNPIRRTSQQQRERVGNSWGKSDCERLLDQTKKAPRLPRHSLFSLSLSLPFPTFSSLETLSRLCPTIKKINYNKTPKYTIANHFKAPLELQRPAVPHRSLTSLLR